MTRAEMTPEIGVSIPVRALERGKGNMRTMVRCVLHRGIHRIGSHMDASLRLAHRQFRASLQGKPIMRRLKKRRSPVLCGLNLKNRQKAWLDLINRVIYGSRNQTEP